MSYSSSKTRLVYWENQPSLINKANFDTKVTITRAKDTSAIGNYAVAKIEGADHNWHYIPTDTYGLYLTSAEMARLFECYDKFWPVNSKVTVAHSIPTAKYAGTTNTTQLSFNNTIYSFTYILTDLNNVTISSPTFANPDESIDFYRTFDGSTFKDGTRALLPRNAMYYKIPDYLATGNDKFIDTQAFAPMTINPKANLQFPNQGYDELDSGTNAGYRPQFDKYLDQKQLALDFYPDFLQDNANIKALYPGENQDVYTWEVNDKSFCTIDTDPQAFAETFWQFDTRNHGMNSNIVWDDASMLKTLLCPRSRGPFRDPKTQGLNPAGQAQNIRFFMETDKFDDFFCHGMPKWLIKGVPILDPSSNLVLHSFCATVTWEINIEGIPRDCPVPRPLRWGHLYIENIQCVDGLLPNYRSTQVAGQWYTRSWPKKPFTDAMWAGRRRCKRQNISNKDNVGNKDLIYPPVDPGTTNAFARNNKALFTIDNEEIDPNLFITTTMNTSPTKAFNAIVTLEEDRIPIAKRTRSRRKQTLDSMNVDVTIENVINDSDE